MDVKTAVKDKENYGAVVDWFRSQGTLTVEQMALLVDTIGLMSEEIYEHYRALQDICRKEMSGLISGRESLDESGRHQLAYVIEKACGLGILLSEKYVDMVKEMGMVL